MSGYPVPKLIFSQRTDLDTRRTRKEVVDGQQRTAAIIEFIDNKYTLSRGEFIGHTYPTLPEAKQREFVDYMLSADTFTSATEEEIREVFRRINSYQVPLNAQETRHATNQGEFKWFIRDMGKIYPSSFISLGIMAEKQISRMLDLELITEFCDIIVNGIRTSSPKHLDDLYSGRDKSFPDRLRVEEQLNFGLGSIINLQDIHQTKLMSRGNLYSLFAAHIGMEFEDSLLRPVAEAVEPNLRFAPLEVQSAHLTNLSYAIETDDQDYSEFLTANKQATNTAKNRLTRFKYFVKAMAADGV